MTVHTTVSKTSKPQQLLELIHLHQRCIDAIDQLLLYKMPVHRQKCEEAHEALLNSLFPSELIEQLKKVELYHDYQQQPAGAVAVPA